MPSKSTKALNEPPVPLNDFNVHTVYSDLCKSQLYRREAKTYQSFVFLTGDKSGEPYEGFNKNTNDAVGLFSALSDVFLDMAKRRLRSELVENAKMEKLVKRTESKCS